MKYQRVSADELFTAIQMDCEPVVRQLVLRDTLVAESRDQMGVSAVLHCLYDWKLEILETLLSVCPHLDIFDTAALGKTERLQELLACVPELARAWSADGLTALHLACSYGQVEAVEILLQAGADPSARARNEIGSTPLQEAACAGQLNSVLLLLAHEAEVDAADHQGWTALHLAASRGHLQIVELLLLNGTRPRLTEEGQTPRDLAVANGHLETARVLG